MARYYNHTGAEGIVCTRSSLTLLQTKTIEVSAEALQSGSDASLPPLMNPTILEASDDLTNLSHLNEPAGSCTWYLSHIV